MLDFIRRLTSILKTFIGGKNTTIMSFQEKQQAETKKLQSRFFSGNVLAQKGSYLDSKEVDRLRFIVTQPLRSRKLNKTF